MMTRKHYSVIASKLAKQWQETKVQSDEAQSAFKLAAVAVAVALKELNTHFDPDKFYGAVFGSDHLTQ